MQGMNFELPKLEVSNLLGTNANDDALHVISNSCCGILLLLLKYFNSVPENGVKHGIQLHTK